MDTPSTLIGLGLLTIFVLPIFFLIWQQNKIVKSRLKNFKKISLQNNLSTDTVEISATLFLGLDSKAKKLLVIEPTNSMQHQVLDLTHIKNSKVHLHPIPNNSKIIKRVSLDLLGDLNNNILTEIIFYDQDDNQNNNASERLVIANKWNRIINDKLTA